MLRVIGSAFSGMKEASKLFMPSANAGLQFAKAASKLSSKDCPP
jgi:hypothetical protein